ncbi:GNAT family N-acetyltransferase [Lentilactobacillus sp. SPB1-3]|uniref:GNAT family N-acetyltransferase n=1 Tax=Lentilactobacillus terminaliae TaxID=3003483 RepID=A0ACD5DDT4_9LACO|nr:GNAT family N-acetyltransferase [Lentilactobacillus sp. SPB1-3]MCZ0977955.1 GNAT family N-acetyltransferase [Lentilactobacillus sp. SPB1-3]
MKVEINHGKVIRAAASYVRMSVFVIERNIDIQDEFDDKDNDSLTYAVIFDGNLPVATGRFEKNDDHTLRVGRVATLKKYRGQHLGAQILTALEDHARDLGMTGSIIHSELTAQKFYERNGYSVASDIFIEDGVECVIVKKEL